MEIGLNDYQVRARETAAPYLDGVDKLLLGVRADPEGPHDPSVLRDLLRLSYVTLGLAGEAGELANKVKKVIRDDGGVLTPVRARQLIDEAGDCLWYLSELCSVLNIPMSEVAKLNIAKLKERAEKNKLQGAGDNR